MHALLLADLASLISQHGPAILSRRRQIPPEALSRYWSSSRSRCDHWHQTIVRHKQAQEAGDVGALRCWWRDHLCVLEEILISEILTRVTAALAIALDDVHGSAELSPVTHAIQMGHLEARNRVQQLMLDGRGCSVPDAVRLNRLRQGTERWTDALLGRMAIDSPTMIRYSIDPARANAHAEEMRNYGHAAARETMAWLVSTAMRDALMRRSTPEAALPAANRQVADSVMRMLRPDLFDSVGALKSSWLHQLEKGDREGDQATCGVFASTANRGDADPDAPFERRFFV